MKTLDEILREEAEKPDTVRVTLTITNPTDRELRRLRQMAQTVNSHKAPGISRAKIAGDPRG